MAFTNPGLRVRSGPKTVGQLDLPTGATRVHAPHTRTAQGGDSSGEIDGQQPPKVRLDNSPRQWLNPVC